MTDISVSISVDIANLASKIAGFNDAIIEGLQSAAGDVDAIVQAALQSEAPHRTGAYAASIQGTQSSGSGVTLEYTAAEPLTSWIIEGTSPHSIDPVSAKVLRFESGGEVIFARHVNHPGTAPNDFPTRAWANVGGDAVEVIAEMVRQTAAEMMA